jgi:hypothetical protein
MTLVADYCGYCGSDFEREEGEPPEICQECWADPEVAAQYLQDDELTRAEAAHDEDHKREYERFYRED